MTPAPIAEADPDGISTVASRKNLSTCGQNSDLLISGTLR